MRYQFFKDWHFEELARRDGIFSRAGTPTTILIAEVTGLYFLVGDISDWVALGPGRLIGYILAIFAAEFLAIAGYFIYVAYWSRPSNALGSPEEYWRHIDEMEIFCSDNERDFKGEVECGLSRRYMEAANYNYLMNGVRGDAQSDAMKAIFCATVILSIIGVIGIVIRATS